MTELEKLNNGEYYSMDDPEIAKIHYRAATLCQQFNALPITESEEREKVLRQLFGSAGKNLSIKPGFFCDLGINLHVGDNFLTNYNVTILDMASVTIGNNVIIGRLGGHARYTRQCSGSWQSGESNPLCRKQK